MPKPYPAEFRRDVIAVARQGGSIAQTAKDLGITESCLRRWLAADDVENGARPGVPVPASGCGRRSCPSHCESPLGSEAVPHRPSVQICSRPALLRTPV